MLDRTKLDKFGPPGFHLSQKEKDYAQHWVLSYLSRSGFGGVFKGGTCLQKAYRLPRYSEDLDFTLNGLQNPDLDSLSSFLSSAGFSGISFKSESKEMSDSIRLKFHGPLYNGNMLSEGTILLDLSKREKTILDAIPVSITPPYPDLLQYSIKVMDKKEIAAEKVRAIMTRFSARDLFDLYFLVKGGAIPEKSLISEKLKYYSLEFDASLFAKRTGALEKIWKREMTALTPNPVDFQQAKDEVLQAIR